MEEANPFDSFWMAGYECTDKLNAFGIRVDLLKATGHIGLIDGDYSSLAPFGIKTVREGVRWSQVEKTPFVYDWGTVGYMVEKGKAHHIQQVWDLCHFGFPDDLTPLHPMFARRFASFCTAFVKFYRGIEPSSVLIVTPINEVNFLSWLGGDVRGTSPYCTNHGWEVKYGLMRAYIEGCKALKGADDNIRILTTEPLVNVVPPLDATDEEIEAAAAANENQFQSLDMLCGKICPELGGREEFLDILGFNYYYNNQFILGDLGCLAWRNEVLDHRWLPLSTLLTKAYQRYERPVLLAETSHPREDRPLWIEYVGRECIKLLWYGIPLFGVCIYPIIDRPDWDFMDNEWHHSGLWDIASTKDGTLERLLYVPYAETLLSVQKEMSLLQIKSAQV